MSVSRDPAVWETNRHNHLHPLLYESLNYTNVSHKNEPKGRTQTKLMTYTNHNPWPNYYKDLLLQ